MGDVVSDAEWMDRYPGTWRGVRLSRMLPCVFCGDPGYRIPAPCDFPTVVMTVDPPPLHMETENTCPGHEWLVRRYLEGKFAPRRLAAREGRPW